MIQPGFEIIRESRSVKQSVHWVSACLGVLVFLILRLGVRIVQIDRNDLFHHWVLKLECSQVLLAPLLVETVLGVVCSRRRLQLTLSNKALCDYTSS